jgi:hypothetical protein
LTLHWWESLWQGQNTLELWRRLEKNTKRN